MSLTALFFELVYPSYHLGAVIKSRDSYSNRKQCYSLLTTLLCRQLRGIYGIMNTFKIVFMFVRAALVALYNSKIFPGATLVSINPLRPICTASARSLNQKWPYFYRSVLRCHSVKSSWRPGKVKFDICHKVVRYFPLGRRRILNEWNESTIYIIHVCAISNAYVTF